MTILFRDDDDDEINYSQRGRITIFHTYVCLKSILNPVYIYSAAAQKRHRPPTRGD